ncbi:ankyrin repeat domain-containing protein [Thalassotalea sp. G20_0]|uniref:ankyrin repeat domain-containing protein n=1 Tax=Thalassotalea sp. G20_0 TaxID=2821093 RepID=UPI001ADC8CEE|nr:ankyrin repeat domain-containing protein [Thalassotalea sp. G20_0]MBO9494293.1 ankyrin repeat domain-containing protein [Thalassotalea sp. G20_0]
MYTQALNVLKHTRQLTNSQFSAMAANSLRNEAGNKLFSGRVVFGQAIQNLHMSARSERCDFSDDKYRPGDECDHVEINIRDDSPFPDNGDHYCEFINDKKSGANSYSRFGGPIMHSVTPDDLKAFKPIALPVVVCHHLSLETKTAEVFNGRQLIVCETPDTRLIRSPDCQCNTLFRGNADIQELDTLLESRGIDIRAKKVQHITQTSEYGPDDTVYWNSPPRTADPNILDHLQWYLSKEGVDINQPINQAGQTLLHQFCRASCLHSRSGGQMYQVNPDTVVELLLSRGAELVADRFGNTPLHVACQTGASLALMDRLLEKAGGRQEILDAVNSSGRTALSETLSLTSLVGLAVLLLRAGASIDNADNRYENSPLHAMMASRFLDSEKINLLTHHGLDINKHTSDGKLPFNELVRNINTYYFYRVSDTLLYLIKSGLHLNRLDHNGQSLLATCFSVFEDHGDYFRKLELCSYVLKAAYKYNFPGNIDTLKGAISDTLIETRADDIGKLLTSNADVFYLIDNTSDVIADNLSAQNKMTLAALLAKARDMHSPDIRLYPFVYLPREPFAHSCKDSFISQMEATYNAPRSDFARVGLDPESGDSVVRDSHDWGESNCHETEDSEDDDAIDHSDIRLYDWLFEHRFEALHQLLSCDKGLHKAICKHKLSLAGELSDDNQEKLDQLLLETGSMGKY